MSHADIKDAVAYLWSRLTYTFLNLVKPAPHQLLQSLHPVLFSPAVPLLLLVGLSCSLLGYVTFLVLLQQEEKAMQNAATADSKSNGTLTKSLSSLQGPPKATPHPTPQAIVVEYEDEPLDPGPTPAATVASSTPRPRTPSAFSQAPPKMDSDADESRPIRLETTASGLPNVRNGTTCNAGVSCCLF